MTFYVTMVVVLMALINKLQILSSQLTYSSFKCQILRQSLVYFASYHLCYEILSWMIEIVLDEKSFSQWQQLQHWKSLLPDFFFLGIINNVRFTFSVGNTTWVVHN
jgi:hypothetical protein